MDGRFWRGSGTAFKTAPVLNETLLNKFKLYHDFNNMSQNPTLQPARTTHKMLLTYSTCMSTIRPHAIFPLSLKTALFRTTWQISAYIIKPYFRSTNNFVVLIYTLYHFGNCISYFLALSKTRLYMYLYMLFDPRRDVYLIFLII